MARITKKQLVEALTANRGNMSAAARDLDVSRQAVRDRVQRDPALQELVASLNEMRVDKAEEKLDECIARGESWAINLLLRSVGRNRGYGDQMDINQSGGVTVRVITDDND